jgi:hypothetical protein
VRILTHEGHQNRGLVESYRLALSRARGSIVSFLECDDLWHPDNLKKKAAILERHPEVGIVHAAFRPFGDFRGSAYWSLYGWANRLQVPVGRPYDAFGPLLVRNTIPSFTHFVARRSLLDLVPRPQGLACNCDWWTLAHASVRARFYFIPETLTSWRIHRTSSNYGPAKVPVRALREYMFAMYDSLLETEEVRANARYREQIERVRTSIQGLEPDMLDERKSLWVSLRRNPVFSLGLLADAALRRVLFS